MVSIILEQFYTLFEILRLQLLVYYVKLLLRHTRLGFREKNTMLLREKLRDKLWTNMCSVCYGLIALLNYVEKVWKRILYDGWY